MSLYLLLGRVARRQVALLFDGEHAAVLKFAEEVGLNLSLDVRSQTEAIIWQENWGSFRNSVTANFRVISPKLFRVLTWTGYTRMPLYANHAS